MTRATIPPRRKHLYFYALLFLATLFIAVYKPGRSAKAQDNSRAAQVNKLANTLFQ